MQRRLSQRELGSSRRTVLRHVWFSVGVSRGHQPKVFTGLGGNTVAAVGRRKFPFALAFTSERDDIYHLSGTIAATSVIDIVDESVTSLLEIEKTAKCWSRPCVDDSQRRYTGRTSFSLIAVLSETLPAMLCVTIGESIHALHYPEPSQVSRSVAGFGRAGHAFCQQRSQNQNTDWFHLHGGPPPLSCVLHSAINYSVNTRTTALASRERHLCNRDTCPDFLHLSAAAVRLMESVRERLVASWNKAVASAVSTSQHPKQSVTLTSMAAGPAAPAAGKSWRIPEKAPPPQPSKRASFSKGTLEQSRLDRQHRSRLDACVGEGRKVR